MTLHDHGHSHGHHGHSHGEHGHSHSSDDGRDTPKSGHSGFSLASIADSTKSADINIRAAMVHVIGDLLQVKTESKRSSEFVHVGFELQKTFAFHLHGISFTVSNMRLQSFYHVVKL